MDCSKCDISKNCNSCLMGTGKKSAKIMFVADNPTFQESDEGRWMVGNAGGLMRGVLSRIGLDAETDCYFTGIVKCPTPVDDKGNHLPPSREEIKNCEDYLQAEIKIVNPDIIVPLGNVALKQLLGYTGITKFRGKAVEKDGRIIFPIVHPQTLFRQPVHAKNFTTDMKNLQKLSEMGMDYLKRKEVQYRYLEDFNEVKEEIERFQEEAEWLCFDLETTGLNPYKKTSKVVCISMTDKTHYGVTIPLRHKEFTWVAMEYDMIVGLLKQLLENPRIRKMGHNGKFDMKWVLAHYGIDVASYKFDPMIAHYLAISEERGGHGLKDLAWEHTDMGGYDNDLDAYKATLPEAIRHNYDNIPWEILREYAAADVDCTFRLFKIFKPLIDANPKWVELFDIYMEASYALRDMEHDGAYMNPDVLTLYEEVYPRRIEEIEEKLRAFPEVVQIEREKQHLFELRKLEMKKPKEDRDPVILKYNKFKNFRFNFGSPTQLRELLFDKLGLDTPFLTDKAKKQGKKKEELTIQDMSTGAETLEYLEDKHEIANLLSEWRKLDKLYGTYVAPAKDWIGVDGLVHPTFNLIRTVTSRLSSENPKKIGA